MKKLKILKVKFWDSNTHPHFEENYHLHHLYKKAKTVKNTVTKANFEFEFFVVLWPLFEFYRHLMEEL